MTVNTFAKELTSDNPLLNDAYKLVTLTVDINVCRGILAADGDYSRVDLIYFYKLGVCTCNILEI